MNGVLTVLKNCNNIKSSDLDPYNRNVLKHFDMVVLKREDFKLDTIK
jgi:hypothetical protein